MQLAAHRLATSAQDLLQNVRPIPAHRREQEKRAKKCGVLANFHRADEASMADTLFVPVAGPQNPFSCVQLLA